MSSHNATLHRPRASETSSGAFWMVATMLLGGLVGLFAIFALLMWADARDSRRSSAKVASSASNSSMPGMPGMAATDMPGSAATSKLASYAGAAPANADALAKAHKPFPATLPAAPAGPVANVNLILEDVTIQVAPGVRYAAWAWAGGAPGPVIPRPPGTDGQDHAHQQGGDSALG